MENLAKETSANRYYASKKRFGNYISEFSIKSKLALHLRIHTLFGGATPEPYMFLGQILHAMQTENIFKMTSGEQLREYHHLSDDTKAILKLASSPLHGPLDLSHGSPVKLKDLAHYIFEGFGQLSKLQVGVIPPPENDNFSQIFLRPEVLREEYFRDTLPSVLYYLRYCNAMPRI